MSITFSTTPRSFSCRRSPSTSTTARQHHQWEHGYQPRTDQAHVNFMPWHHWRTAECCCLEDGMLGSYSPWTRTNDGPSIRRSFALATLDNGRVMVFGGITFGWFGNVDLNDAWLFELSPFSNIEDGNNGAVGTVRFGLRFC